MNRLLKSLLLAAGMALASAGAFAAKDEPKAAGAEKAAPSSPAAASSSGKSDSAATKSSAKSDSAMDKSSGKSDSAMDKSSGKSDTAMDKSSGKSDTAMDKSSGKSDTAAGKSSAAATIDLNTASEKELASLPQVGEARAKAIVAGRPYARKDELVSKKIVSQKVYDDIKNKVVAKQASAGGAKTSASGASTSATTKSDAAADKKK